jgi:hypothetical protein
LFRAIGGGSTGGQIGFCAFLMHDEALSVVLTGAAKNCRQFQKALRRPFSIGPETPTGDRSCLPALGWLLQVRDWIQVGAAFGPLRWSPGSKW